MRLPDFRTITYLIFFCATRLLMFYPNVFLTALIRAQYYRETISRHQARTIYDARVTAPASARNGVAHAASNGPTRNTFVESGSHAGGSVNSGTHTKAADVGGGGLVDWAMWPLWTTIDALKWAGGTVNEVAVAPVIRLASPWGLGGSILTTAKAITPQRARDLARVVGNGLLNAAGLARTPAGGAFLQTSGRAAGSLSMAVSSPAGRQFLVDSATGFVKLAEALDTPEAKNAIRQGAVVVARAMDALASRDSKIFVKVRRLVVRRNGGFRQRQNVNCVRSIWSFKF